MLMQFSTLYSSKIEVYKTTWCLGDDMLMQFSALYSSKIEVSKITL